MKEKMLEQIKKHKASYIYDHSDYARFEGWLAGFLLALNMTGVITPEEHVELLNTHDPSREAERFNWCSKF